MRVAQFVHEGLVSWGFVEDGQVFRADEGSLAAALAAEVDLSAATPAAAPTPIEDVELQAPITDPPQFVGVGLNYRRHAAEAGADIPATPLTFAFLPSAITHPGHPIEIPAFTDEVDWEVEMGIVIGKPGRDIPPDKALDHVAGYTIVNDVSARDIQMSEGQWSRAKSFDSFKPMGPWMTGVDELGAADDLQIRLWVNGELKQSSSTNDLIFDVPTLVSFMSAAVTLRAGAVISTGTPSGVGFARDPAEFLRAGDTVSLEIEGIGTLTNPVVAAGASVAAEAEAEATTAG